MNKSVFVAAALALGCAGGVYAETPDFEETWSELGTGLIRDDLLSAFYFISFPEFECQILKSDQVPGRYKVMNAYAKHPWGSNGDLNDHEHSFVIDAEDPDHVWIEKGCLGMNYTWNGQPNTDFSIWSTADNEYNNKWGDWERVEENCGRIWGTLRDGVITFPPGQLLVYYYIPDEENPDGPHVHPDGGNQTNASGKFRIKLPGAPAYDMESNYMGATGIAPDATLNFMVLGGNDIKGINYGITSGDPAEYAETLRAGGGAKADMSAADRFGYLTLGVPYQGDGAYTFVAVGFNAAGEAKMTTETEFEVQIDESLWKKYGTTTWNEGFLWDHEGNMYQQLGLTAEEIPCEIEWNATAGEIRLVNPFANHSMASRQTYDSKRNYYMVLNIADYDCVHIPLMEATGINLGYGEHYIWSRANRSIVRDGMSKDYIKTIEGTFGTLDTETGEITFPKDALLFEFHVRGLSWPYWANRHGEFKVNVPQTLLDDILAGVPAPDTEATDATEAYYTIGGTRVTDMTAPGLYIVRKGNTASKLLVR